MTRSIAAALLLAHSWYPHECCAEGDCHPVPCEEITRSADGYYRVWHGYSFSEPQHKFSPDGECHVCLSKQFPLMGTLVPHCIFTPPPALS